MAGVAQRLQIVVCIAATCASRSNVIYVCRGHRLASVQSERIDAQRMPPQIHDTQPTPPCTIATLMRICALIIDNSTVL